MKRVTFYGDITPVVPIETTIEEVNGDQERLIRKFLKKYKKEEIQKEIFYRTYYKTKSQKRREKRRRFIYEQRINKNDQ